MVAVIEWLHEHKHEISILLLESEDVYNHTRRFDFANVYHSQLEFLSSIEENIISFGPNIIHITDDLEALLLAREVVKETPIVFSIHSASIVNQYKDQELLKKADRILVSTPDILSELDSTLDAEWYDRPTPKWFKYTGGRKDRTALMIFSQDFPKDCRDLAKSWCEERVLKLTILNRDETHYNHREMPDLYSKFEYVLDFKGYEDHPDSLSKVAREASLCGCKIVHDSNLQKVILPGELPRVTEKKFIDLYKELISLNS